MTQKRRSIFNQARLETKQESISNISNVNFEKELDKEFDKVYEELTNTKPVQKEKRLIKYAVYTKVSKPEDREIRAVTYIIESESKTKAGEIGRDKLIENGYNKKNIILSRVIKAKSNQTNEDVLFEKIKINYEVSFNIKIGLERFRKTFIIKAGTEQEASSLMLLRCKKEFKGYKSITKVDIKEADKNSKESSELIEPAKIIPLSSNENKIKQENEVFDDSKETVDTSDEITKIINNCYNEFIKKRSKEELSQQVITAKLCSRNKEAQEFIESSNMDKVFYIKTNSLSVAKDIMEGPGSPYGSVANRKLRRNLKYKYNFIDVKTASKEEVLGSIIKNTLKLYKEFQGQEEEINKEDENKEGKKTLKDVKEILMNKIKEMYEEMLEDISVENMKKIKEDFKNNMISKNKMQVMKIDPDSIKNNIEVLTNDSGDINRIKSKGTCVLTQKLPEYTCTMILMDETVCTPIIVEASSIKEAVKLLLMAVSVGYFEGLKSDEVDEIKVTKLSDKGVESATVKVAE